MAWVSLPGGQLARVLSGGSTLSIGYGTPLSRDQPDLIEKTLPAVESLGLLSFMQSTLDVEAGLLFSAANWLIVLFPIYVALAICGFAPIPAVASPLFVAEFLLFGGTTVLGVALFAWAYFVSLLQEDYAA